MLVETCLGFMECAVFKTHQTKSSSNCGRVNWRLLKQLW